MARIEVHDVAPRDFARLQSPRQLRVWLRRASVDRRGELLRGWLFRTLHFSSLKHVRDTRHRIQLNRVMGSGFPLDAIAETVHASASKYR